MTQHTMALPPKTENSPFAHHWHAYQLEVLLHQSKLQSQKRFRFQAQLCAVFPLLVLLILVWFCKDHQQATLALIGCGITSGVLLALGFAVDLQLEDKTETSLLGLKKAFDQHLGDALLQALSGLALSTLQHQYQMDQYQLLNKKVRVTHHGFVLHTLWVTPSKHGLGLYVHWGVGEDVLQLEVAEHPERELQQMLQCNPDLYPKVFGEPLPYL